jgi:hypothetical protein
MILEGWLSGCRNRPRVPASPGARGRTAAIGGWSTNGRVPIVRGDAKAGGSLAWNRTG